jgi:outer membrane immunogenic protein
MKRMFRLAALSGICIIVAGGAASAADVAEPIPADTWTGFYVGVGGGYQWAGFDADLTSCTDEFCNEDDTVLGANLGEAYSVDLEDSGWFATGQLGFDYQLHDSFVIGAMVDISGGQELSDSNFRKVDYPPFGNPLSEEGMNAEASLEGMLTLSGRAGFLVTPEALVYGLAGWSWAKAEVSAFEGCDFDEDGGTYCDDLNPSNDDTLNGWTLGGGVEWLFMDNLSARFEYRYTDLGSLETSETVPDTRDDGTIESDRIFLLSSETDFSVQSVRFTLNYRF